MRARGQLLAQLEVNAMSEVTDPTVSSLLSELREGLGHLYGQGLKGLYLFGSYARGEPRDESDVDVLIVLEEVTRYSAEINRTSFLISDLSLKYDLPLSRVIVSESRWKNSEDLFYQNVRQEAIPA